MFSETVTNTGLLTVSLRWTSKLKYVQYHKGGMTTGGQQRTLDYDRSFISSGAKVIFRAHARLHLGATWT